MMTVAMIAARTRLKSQRLPLTARGREAGRPCNSQVIINKRGVTTIIRPMATSCKLVLGYSN
jgi:hypothetical protein